MRTSRAEATTVEGACLTPGDRIEGGILGALVGDAFGVPVEFSQRRERIADPVVGMRGYGSWSQPPGTWSDDGALLLCTAESLLKGVDLDLAGGNYLRWWRNGHFSARGDVFDIGMATERALLRIAGGEPAARAGGITEHDNGNGALMRILPVALRFPSASPAALLGLAGDFSAITHGHPRSRLACGFLCLVAQCLARGEPALDAWRQAVAYFNSSAMVPEVEAAHFSRVCAPGFPDLSEDTINSSGYVIDTLEAALWCLLQGGSFSDITLRAINLGGDTDTTGCVTGGLAGVLYGRTSIPSTWLDTLPQHDGVRTLLPSFVSACLEP